MKVIKPKLTGRQRVVLDAIKRYIAEHGYPPTRREIGQLIGASSFVRAACDHLKALERKGYITMEKGVKARAIRVVDEDPLRGSIDFIMRCMRCGRAVRHINGKPAPEHMARMHPKVKC